MSDSRLERDVSVGTWLDRYSAFLDSVQGLASSTRQRYLFFARRFLETRFGEGGVDWSLLSASDITSFVEREASRLRRNGRKSPGSAVRSLLRFLVIEGEIRAGFEAAVPLVPTWKQASLPRYISAAEVDRILSGCNSATPAGLRDRAIILLLSRLGLRAREVMSLRLDDLIWQDGVLIVQPGKTRRERRLPIPRDVGAALVEYLKGGRPPTADRTVFISTRPGALPFVTPSAITRIVQRLAKRVGVALPAAGAHVLRHTAATRMVRSGASFKEIADVLGHQSIDSTAIYAKLDINSLAKVALPWPGGVR